MTTRPITDQIALNVIGNLTKATHPLTLSPRPSEPSCQLLRLTNTSVISKDYIRAVFEALAKRADIELDYVSYNGKPAYYYRGALNEPELQAQLQAAAADAGKADNLPLFCASACTIYEANKQTRAAWRH